MDRTQLAEAAHVDRKSVWSAFQRDEFVEAYNQVCLFLLKERVGEILEPPIRAAKGNSFADRQTLLQMAGLSPPTSRVEVTGRDGKPVQVESTVGLVREASQATDAAAPVPPD